MSIFKNLLGGGNSEETVESKEEAKTETKYEGKIIKVSGEGYGFISCKDIPFTRIFFHWTSLRPDTLKFQELKSGMKVSFVGFEVPEKGWRAIKISVIEGSEKE